MLGRRCLLCRRYVGKQGGKGWCHAHYKAWKVHGNANHYALIKVARKRTQKAIRKHLDYLKELRIKRKALLQQIGRTEISIAYEKSRLEREYVFLYSDRCAPMTKEDYVLFRSFHTGLDELQCKLSTLIHNVVRIDSVKPIKRS